MTFFRRAGTTALLFTVAFASPLLAQRAQPTFEAGDSVQQRAHHAWRPLRIAKWSTLGAATAAVVYGFTQNRQADREYAGIEELCIQSPEQCARNADNSYADAALEQRYQNVVTRDQHARLGLLLGQAGLVASVALFLLDLHNSAAPEDIPYEPKPFTVGAARHGVELRWRQPLF